jgi:hypothetical protein
MESIEMEVQTTIEIGLFLSLFDDFSSVEKIRQDAKLVDRLMQLINI